MSNAPIWLTFQKFGHILEYLEWQSNWGQNCVNYNTSLQSVLRISIAIYAYVSISKNVMIIAQKTNLTVKFGKVFYLKIFCGMAYHVVFSSCYQLGLL